jgi:hypothetical protein
MITEGTPVYVMLADELDEGTLHPGIVVDDDDDTYTVELEEEDLFPQVGQSVSIYFYEAGTHFMQRAAQIEAVMEDGTNPIVALKAVGEIVSAENRQCFRVSTVTGNQRARVGREEGCRVMDISATGFSILTEQPYRVGEVLEVEIEFEGQAFSGPVRVQGLRDVGRGGKRCGLHCNDDRYTKGTLQKGLQHISMSIQRQQLRRMRGTG